MVGQTGEKISFFKQKIKPKGVDEALKFSQFTSYFTLQLVPEVYLEIFLRERAVIAAWRFAHSFAKKNFKKNLWDQGAVVVFVQGRESNAQSCCFSYLTYCILDRVPLPSLFRKVPNSSSSCESSKCCLSSHKLQCNVEKNILCNSFQSFLQWIKPQWRMHTFR